MPPRLTPVDPSPSLDRRSLLGAAAGLALGHLALALPVEALSATPLPAASLGLPSRRGTLPRGTGKPGEFDFLAGNWNISHRFRKFADKDEWDRFKGEATCWTILAGVGSIEELRIPERNFSGLGIRLLDIEQKLWSDFFVNAKSGVLTSPGTTGSFVDGAGIFISDEKDGETPIKVRGMWDNISKTTCRWTQSVSRDDGKTWRDGWIMDWTRA